MGKLNMDLVKQKLDKESQNGYSNAEYDKLVQGKNVRRILWPKGNSELFYEEGYLHFSLGAEGNKVATCPKTFSSKNRCPICEYVEQLQKSKNKDDKKLADNIKAKRRIYVNVLNRDDEDDEETPKVLPIGVTILKALLDTICDLDYGDITDPDEGRDVTITRKGQGLKTEYSVLPKPKSSVVSDSLSVEEIEEQMTDLSSLFVEKSYEELEEILTGVESEGDDDEDEDDQEEAGDEYDEMTLTELKALCKKRKLELPDKVNKIKLIALLTAADEEENSEEDTDEDDDSDTEDESEQESEDDDDEESDDVKDAIAQALARRKKGKK